MAQRRTIILREDMAWAFDELARRAGWEPEAYWGLRVAGVIGADAHQDMLSRLFPEDDPHAKRGEARSRTVG